VQFTVQFSGEDGQMNSEIHPTAASALARWSELLSPPANRPLVYITDQQGRDIDQEELEEFAKREAD
jgi:hypothetical protein